MGTKLTGGEYLADVQERAGIRPPFGRGILGLPRRTAAGLIRPHRIPMVESASVWKYISISRPVYIWCPAGPRTIRYVPDRLRESGADTITGGLYNSSTSGLLRLLNPGDYYLNTPIVTAEGTRVDLAMTDAALDQGVGPEDVVGEAIPGGGGAASALTWTTVAQLTINGSDSAVAAANAQRRGLSMFNGSTAGQRIAVTNQAAATAVTRGIWFLDPGIGVYLGPNDGVPLTALRGWASAAGALLNFADAT